MAAAAFGGVRPAGYFSARCIRCLVAPAPLGNTWCAAVAGAPLHRLAPVWKEAPPSAWPQALLACTVWRLIGPVGLLQAPSVGVQKAYVPLRWFFERQNRSPRVSWIASPWQVPAGSSCPCQATACHSSLGRETQRRKKQRRLRSAKPAPACTQGRATATQRNSACRAGCQCAHQQLEGRSVALATFGRTRSKAPRC